MAEEERLTRPTPKQARPNRKPSDHLRNASSARSGAGAAGKRQSSAPHKPTDKVINDAVGLAYQVIEEQIVHGRRVAEQLRDGAYHSGDVEADVKALVERMVRVAKDFGFVWFDLLLALVRDPRLQSSLDRAGLSRGASAARPAPSVEIRGSRRTEVRCDLKPTSTPAVPVVPPLHAADPKIRPLTDVRFRIAQDGESAVVSIAVPDDQPAGTYSGAVVTGDTHEPIGTILVRVLPHPPKRAR
jgi:hypothetical protein